MESDNFPNQENVSPDEGPEVTSKVREALRDGVVAALAEYKAIETANDLIQNPWLMDMVVRKTMDSVEQSGVSLDGFEISVSNVIAQTLIEVLPEGPDGGEGPESTGVREPRRPILPSLLGSIAMALPNDSPEAA